MATAALSLELPSKPNIDREKGIVRDCILAENGKLAVFKGTDGKAKKLLMTPALIASLMALFAADGQTTAHWTHDWIESGKDGLTSKVATFRNFTTNEAGHLVADAHLWPTDKREAILHAAEKDPAGMMISTVFDYDGGETDAIAKRVHAADFVEVGASTTALLAKLSEPQTKPNTMTEEDKAEVAKMIADAITAANKPADEAAEMATAEAAEADAGVTDADKKKEDEDKPAALRAALRIARATTRLTLAALATAKDETVTLAEARFTKALGSGKFTVQSDDKSGDELDKALAAYTATGASKATAILRLAKDNPTTYNAARAAGKL
jgi:hypothetical protein